MKKIGLLAGACLLSACATTSNKQVSKIDCDSVLVKKGAELTAAGSSQKAIDDYFNPVIARCEKQQKSSKVKLYAARTPVETLTYLAMAGVVNTNAEVVSPTCPEALFLKAYANVDLGKLDEAIQLLNEALVWSPFNSTYLSELGNIYQTQHDWKGALDKYTTAEDYAKSYSPDEIKNRELTRAKRGMGFALIELGNLDEAEKKFNECLDIDKDDKKALNELEYIKQVRGAQKKAS